MKILFLHNNYPGQFVHIANALSAFDDNEVVFISQYKRDGIACKNIRHILAPIRKPASYKSKIENILIDSLHIGEDYANSMMKIKNDGFYPDIVYDHSGWGVACMRPTSFQTPHVYVIVNGFMGRMLTIRFLSHVKNASRLSLLLEDKETP